VISAIAVSRGTYVGDLDLALVLVKGQLPKVEVQIRQFARVLRALQRYGE